MTQAQADQLKTNRSAALDDLAGIATASGNTDGADHFSTLKAALVADANEEVSEAVLAKL